MQVQGWQSPSGLVNSASSPLPVLCGQSPRKPAPYRGGGRASDDRRGRLTLLREKRVLHGVEDGGAAGGKVDAALQIAGVGRAQRTIAGNLDRAALGKAAAGHDDLVGVARLVGRLGAGKAVHRAVVLDARAEASQRGGTARVKAGHNIVVVGRVARHGVDARQLQQTLGINRGFQRLADNARGVVEAEEGIPQAVLRAAQIAADAGRGEAVAALFHQIAAARNVAAGGGDAAARGS